MKEYYKIFASIEEVDYLKSVKFLKKEISNFFIKEYYKQYTNSEIVEFEVNGYTYLFAINIEVENKKVQNDDRIVGVYGLVSKTDEKRDSNRMKGFVGSFTKLEKYKGYDKGHYVAHKINGNLDQNLYPQLKELNRGWSKQGKLFRSLERYCENNPDSFLFTRPVYLDETWIPAYVDYGIFTKEFGLLLNRFGNKKQ